MIFIVMCSILHFLKRKLKKNYSSQLYPQWFNTSRIFFDKTYRIIIIHLI
jgi:hypothetical protein